MPILVLVLSIIATVIWHNPKITNKLERTKENVYTELQKKEADNSQINNETKETNENLIKGTVENEKLNNKSQKWEIEIPEISLVAPISEGTEQETLNKFVGHFPITPKTEGNVGLAAHNRGYPVNYFENLKKLQGGEEIIYTYGEFEKRYVVTKNIKISDIDWSYLENSNENKITLITCIENEPEYRRCVQAIEKEEN